MTNYSVTDCTKYTDDLKAYADGELPLPRRFAVRRHLAHCPACREEIAAMTQLTEDLRTSETEGALNADLREKLLGITPPAPNTGGAGVSPPRRRLRPSLRWGLAGAALLAWVIIFPSLQKQKSQQAQVTTPLTANAPPPPSQRRARAETARSSGGLNAPGAPPPVTYSGPISNAAAGTDSNGVPNAPVVRSFAGQTYDYNPATPTRQVHKEASITVQLANPEATSDTVETMVRQTGGFVASNTLDTSAEGLKSAELVVKVPMTQFETFLAQVARLGSVQAKNVTGEDITEQTSDADSEENVLEGDVARSEARLKALGGKAKWRDEQAVRDLRVQLAQSRARLVLLKRMAALSTITIDLDQTPKKAAVAPITGGFWGGLKDTTRDAGQSLVGAAGALAALVIWLLAYAPLWIPALLLARYGLKEYRRREAT